MFIIQPSTTTPPPLRPRIRRHRRPSHPQSDAIIDTEEVRRSSSQQQREDKLAPSAPTPLLPSSDSGGHHGAGSGNSSSSSRGPGLGLPPPPPSHPSRLSPAVAELLVVNAVVAWACVVLALDPSAAAATTGGGAQHRLEALMLLALGLAAHAGVGPSQFRFAADAGVAVGLTALPCMLASLFLVSGHDGTHVCMHVHS